MYRTVTSLFAALALSACAQAPLAPEAYEFEPDWGYVVVTKDAPQIEMQALQLCRLDDAGSYTITFANGFHHCHPQRRRGEPSRAINLYTTEGSVTLDRRILLPDGRTAHVLPYSPFTPLGIRYSPIPGEYAIAVTGQNEAGRIHSGDVRVIDLDGRNIVYLGHVTSNGVLTWQDPGVLGTQLAQVPGFSTARFKADEPSTATIVCTGAPVTVCQRQ